MSYHVASAAVPDPGSACGGCGLDVRGLGEFGYMVSAGAWSASGGGAGKLCVGCLEARLGRRLAPGDFPPLPCNDPFRLRSLAEAPGDPGEWWFQFQDQSDRLLDRLGVRPADAAAMRALPGWPHGAPPFLALRRVAAMAAGYGVRPARPGRPDWPVRGARSLFAERRVAMDIRAAEAAERIRAAQPEWDGMAERFLTLPSFRAALPTLVGDGDAEASIRRLAEGIARLDGLPKVDVACVAEAVQYHDPRHMSNHLTPTRRKLLSGGFQPMSGPGSPIWERMEGAFAAAGMPFPPAGMTHGTD